mmetsp:Transcript_123548/g.345936  ORF Transcript_123548/g.345936 Transcript_123548/m.345936 type:complete len:246 (-) Transcript_123548:121-858(-)
MSETRDATLRKALPNMCGRPASVGMPSSRLKAAMFEMPARNFWMRTVSLMSSTADGNTAPSWKIMLTSMPYSKGLMFSLPSSTAALGETFSPVFRIGNSETSSIWPLTILVPMFRAWKKFVCEGSMPVGPEGRFSAATATCPALAAESRRCLLRVSRMSSRVQFVAKMKPMLPWMLARNFSMPASGCFSCPISRALRIIVFFPISTTAFPRSSKRMSCICFEATWSTLTMRALGELTHKSMSLLK